MLIRVAEVVVAPVIWRTVEVRSVSPMSIVCAAPERSAALESTAVVALVTDAMVV